MSWWLGLHHRDLNEPFYRNAKGNKLTGAIPPAILSLSQLHGIEDGDNESLCIPQAALYVTGMELRLEGPVR